MAVTEFLQRQHKRCGLCRIERVFSQWRLVVVGGSCCARLAGASALVWPCDAAHGVMTEVGCRPVAVLGLLVSAQPTHVVRFVGYATGGS